MQFFNKVLQSAFGKPINEPFVSVKESTYVSNALKRGVKMTIFLPPNFRQSDRNKTYSLCLFNDGQDMPALKMEITLNALYATKKIQDIIIVALHCNHERHQEYGTISRPDYKKRGSKAPQYAAFILNELLPFLHKEYSLKKEPQHTTFAGFSLGGLSAFDIAWANGHIFGKIGIFSGALWWRWRDYTPQDPDGGRILHEVVEQSAKREGMKFWFQTGTLDETEDRNNNGIIDSIDDTIDLMNLLFDKKYSPHEDVKYTEIINGHHDTRTWGEIMPEFLTWAYGR